MSEGRKRPQYTIVQHPAFPKGYTVCSFIDQAKFESAIGYQAMDDDTFIASYPKNGTTWLMNILYLIKNDGKPLDEGDNMHYHIPFLEFDGGDAVRAFPRPRIIKTHMYYGLTPRNQKSKYVFVARNPKDCAVSFYNHTVGFDEYYHFAKGSFDDFFEVFMEGRCDSGYYFQMVPEWHAKSLQCDNVHFMLYEDMKNDIRGEILKMADFLGMECRQKLEANNWELLNTVIELSSFSVMKRDVSKFCLETRPAHLPFVRKGVIGDWKSVLSSEQSERINEKLTETGKQYPGFAKLWDKYDELLK